MFSPKQSEQFPARKPETVRTELYFLLSLGGLASMHTLIAALWGPRSDWRRLHSCVAVSRREHQSAQQVASAKGTG